MRGGSLSLNIPLLVTVYVFYAFVLAKRHRPHLGQQQTINRGRQAEAKTCNTPLREKASRVPRSHLERQETK